MDFKKIISTVRSRRINCQVIVQSAAQLSDRYPKKEWEEIVGNCDTQLFLGCNDQMTADFISKKCGMVTIKVENNQMPLMPLFSPVLHTTRPYSQTKSNTQRALMLPDEVLRLPNEQAIVFLRGQKPLLLYKIIPDELPAYEKLESVKISDYQPEWRCMEAKLKVKTEVKPELSGGILKKEVKPDRSGGISKPEVKPDFSGGDLKSESRYSPSVYPADPMECAKPIILDSHEIKPSKPPTMLKDDFTMEEEIVGDEIITDASDIDEMEGVREDVQNEDIEIDDIGIVDDASHDE